MHANERLRTEFSAFCVFLMCLMGTIHELSRIDKRNHRFCYSVFAFKKIIFATVFLAISFQFLANKRYLNRLLKKLKNREFKREKVRIAKLTSYCNYFLCNCRIFCTKYVKSTFM